MWGEKNTFNTFITFYFLHFFYKLPLTKKHLSTTTFNVNVLMRQSPDSERLQPPQGPSLTAHSTAFIMSHPVEESGQRLIVIWYQINRIFSCPEPLCLLLPALFLSFLWCSDGQTLVHVAVEQSENVASCQKACRDE